MGNSKKKPLTLFEKTLAQLDIRHKKIRAFTPRHNGKVERSHREDRKRSYSCHTFHSLDDFAKQLALLNRRSNNFPMRPLSWLSPVEFSVQFVWQTCRIPLFCDFFRQMLNFASVLSLKDQIPTMVFFIAFSLFFPSNGPAHADTALPANPMPWWNTR